MGGVKWMRLANTNKKLTEKLYKHLVDLPETPDTDNNRKRTFSNR